jgi:alanine-glyoxylate transaminase/serine-glyoxylate transaminase/serine-pyruvate transaminase
MEGREHNVQSWFLDLTMVRNYWQGAKRAYHHTAPVSQIFALHESLRIVLEEGLDARFARHRANHELLRDGLQELGFEYLVDEQYRLPMLNAVKLPAGLEDAPTRAKLLNDYNIEVGGGLGAFAGKIWRIGIMGESCTPNHVDMLLSALKRMV